MTLSQLIYSSDVLDLGPGKADALLDDARRRNRESGLTGVLLFNRNHVLQCLEGSREQVSATFHRIAADPRHTNVTLLSVRDIDQRDFPDWTMGFVPDTADTRSALRRIVDAEDFAPRGLSPASALGLVRYVRSLEGATVPAPGPSPAEGAFVTSP
jgi:hypothetical protein